MRLPCFCACGRSARVLAHGSKHADSSDEDEGISAGISGTKQPPRLAESATAWRADPRKPQPSGKSGRQGRPVTATAAWPKVKDTVKEDSMVVRIHACSRTPVTSFAFRHLGATPPNPNPNLYPNPLPTLPRPNPNHSPSPRGRGRDL